MIIEIKMIISKEMTIKIGIVMTIILVIKIMNLHKMGNMSSHNDSM